MAKLSELFGRKANDGSNTSASRPGPAGPNDDTPPKQAQNFETFSDIGSRMGEENEALRNLLNDTARKISELDELKETFYRLVQPFNSTLRALEQEKSQTVSLTNRLDEARAAYETLRAEFYAIEKKTTGLEAENDKQRDEIEITRETNRTLESKQFELTDEIRTRSVQIAELELQLEQEQSQRRNLNEIRGSMQEQIDDSDQHILALESDLAASREKLALVEDDKRSLETSLDRALNETARLNQRLTETENGLTAARAELGKIEKNFAEVFAERDRLAAALDESKEQHQTDRSNLTMRLGALQSRAATAERLLAEARQNLIARTEEVRAFDRRSVEATIARNNSEKRLAQLEASQERRERHIHDLEQARVALAERNGALTKTLKSRDAALARAEEKIASLTQRNGHLEADIQVSRTNIEKRIDDLNSALQRERVERAVVEGALEAARRDNDRLQSEVTGLRSSLRRGPVIDGQMTPGEPANDQALRDAAKEAAKIETINAAIAKSDR